MTTQRMVFLLIAVGALLFSYFQVYNMGYNAGSQKLEERSKIPPMPKAVD